MYESFHSWILENFEPNQIMLEFGSGPGTLIFSEKFKVYSIEHDEKWVGHSDKSNYIHAPIINGWYDVEVIKERVLDLKYDFVLVDGPTGIIGRKGLLKNINLFNTLVPWIFDDVNRKEEYKIMKEFSNKTKKQFKIFKGSDREFSVLL